VKGYKLSVDDAGKTTVELANKTASAASSINRSVGSVASAWGNVVNQLQQADAWTARVQARNDEVSKNSLGGATYDKQGFATNTAGQRVEMLVQTLDSMKALIKERGGTDAQAEQLAPGLLSQWNSIDAMAWRKGMTTSSISGMNRNWNEVLASALESSGIGQAAGAPGPSPSPAPAPSTQRPYVVNLSYNDTYYGPVPTDQTGTGTLERFMQALNDGRATAL
jgi:hypothetical protein